MSEEVKQTRLQGGEEMRVVIDGTPQEIASLVSELQGMHADTFTPSDSSSEDASVNQKCPC